MNSCEIYVRGSWSGLIWELEVSWRVDLGVSSRSELGHSGDNE